MASTPGTSPPSPSSTPTAASPTGSATRSWSPSRARRSSRCRRCRSCTDRRARGARDRRRGAGAGRPRRTTAAICQRDVAARLLAKAGADVERLLCGAHWPIGMRAAGRHPCAGEDRDPLRHNCSGKHAGFLARRADARRRARALSRSRFGGPARGPARGRRRVRARRARTLVAATDGCSAPNYDLPLSSLARGVQEPGDVTRPARPARRSTRRLRACARRCRRTRRWCRADALRLRADRARSAGRIVCKGGAEALLGDRVFRPALGIAVKVLDGGDRACRRSCLAVLPRSGCSTARSRAALAERVRPIVTNHRGTETGAIVASVTLEKCPPSAPFWPAGA